MILVKLKVCEDPIVLDKHEFEIGNNRVSSFTINAFPFDSDPLLYELDIRGEVMKDYSKLVDRNDDFLEDDEEQLYFNVIKDLTEYVIEPISQHMKSGVFFSEIVVGQLRTTTAVFIAPNAYAFDINYPKGKIRVGADHPKKRRARFQEIHLFNTDYRYLIDNIEKYYQDLTSKILTNVKRSLPKKPKGVNDEI